MNAGGGDDTEALHEIIDPPYSFAVVAVIAANVAVQVILQSILFSTLQWSLRPACEMFVFIFIAVTIAFAVASLFYFGVQSLCQQGKVSFHK
jgi:heme/copper-type cytochrome/quinol oxidase subunit 4